MSAPLDALRGRYDRIAIPTIWLAFALSLVLHALLLVGRMPKVQVTPSEGPEPGKSSASLAVRLAPMPSISSAPAPMSQANPAQNRAQSTPSRIPAPRAAQRRPLLPSAPLLALERPPPSRVAPPAPEIARAPATEDFASNVEARQRARGLAAAGPPSPPAESEQERIDRDAATRLGLNRTPSFGSDPARGGGIFQIARMGYNDAEFFFYGWNKAIRRNSRQMIEVQRGNNPSMEIAVVRRMIQIIRDHEREDFIWESHRLGREVNLSARQADNAGLEDFLMMEFFSGNRPRQ